MKMRINLCVRMTGCTKVPEYKFEMWSYGRTVTVLGLVLEKYILSQDIFLWKSQVRRSGVKERTTTEARRMSRPTNERKDGRTDGRTDGQTDGRTDGRRVPWSRLKST